MPTFSSVDDALLVLGYPDHPGWGEALHYLLHHAPEPMRSELRAGMDRAMKSAGLEFNSVGYLEDGEAVVSLAEVAEQLGVTEAEVMARVRKLEAQDGSRYLHKPGEVHKAH